MRRIGAVTMKVFFNSLSHFLLKYRLWVLLFCFGMTALSLPYAISLYKNIKTDFAALLPEDRPSVKRVEEIGKKFGSVKNLIVIFETNKKESVEKMFADFEAHLKKMPEVDHVRYKMPAHEFLQKHKLLYLTVDQLKNLQENTDREIQRKKLGWFYILFDDDEVTAFDELRKTYGFILGGDLESGLLTNEEKNIFLFEVFPSAEVGTHVQGSKDFFAKIQNAVKTFDATRYDPDIKISWSGGIKSVVDEYDSLMRDVSLAGLVSWVLIVIFLIIYFRNIALMVICLIPLLVGLVWTFGIAYFVIGQLNIITAFLFSILGGLGIDAGIHYITRYFEQKRSGMTQEESFAVMLSSTGHATALAVLTNIAGFFVLVFSDFRGFSEFGWIATIGMAIIFFCYSVMIIPLIYFVKKWNWVKWNERTATHLIHPLGFMKKWTTMRYERTILIFSVVLFIAAAALAYFRLGFDYDFSKLKAHVEASQTAKGKTFSVYQAKTFPALVHVNNDAEALAVKEYLLKYRDSDPTPTFSEILTSDDLFAKDQNEKLKILKEIRTLLQDEIVEKVLKIKKDRAQYDDLFKATNAASFTKEEVPEELTKIFRGVQHEGDDQFVLIRPSAKLNLENGHDSIALSQDLSDIKVGDKTYHGVQHNMIFADLMTTMMTDSKVTVGLAMLAVFILLWFGFKNIKKSLLVIVSLLVGILWMVFVMGIFNINLNLFNMVVLPCIVGLGIDHSVHIFHRVEEEGMSRFIPTVMDTGTALIMTVITNMAGFFGLILAHHNGLRSIGVLALIGQFTTLVAALIFFPALIQKLQHSKHFFKTKSDHAKKSLKNQ